MSTGRRPPPPPPPEDDDDDDGSQAPPLPDRPHEPAGDRRGGVRAVMDQHVPALPPRPNDKRSGTQLLQQQPQQQDDDDATYEQPKIIPCTNMTTSAGGGTGFTPSSRRHPVPDNSDSESDGGWFDEFDEEDNDAVVRSHEQDEGLQSGDLYVEPDGVPKDGLNGDSSKKNVIPRKPEQSKSGEKPNPPSKPDESKFQIIQPGKSRPPQPKPKPVVAEKPQKPLPKPPDHKGRMESPGAPSSGLTEAKPKNKTPSFLGNSLEHNKPVGADAGVYDDGSSEVLSNYDWFHGELDRDEASRRVKQLSESGAFLVRASMTDSTKRSEEVTHPYTLVVASDNKLYNLMIRLREDGRFAIGKVKQNEVSFANVPELIRHHMENNIKLTEGGFVKLKRSPKK